jgi:hypothetical protein
LAVNIAVESSEAIDSKNTKTYVLKKRILNRNKSYLKDKKSKAEKKRAVKLLVSRKNKHKMQSQHSSNKQKMKKLT